MSKDPSPHNSDHFLGFGLGLRPDHYHDILAQEIEVDWFEALSENYLVPGGKPLYYLDKISERFPMVMHGVSMSIGSPDPLNWSYLKQLKALSQRINARWLSDHLCWTGMGGKNMHDLLPLPYTEESIQYLASRISQVQDFLGHQILIENVSSYLTYRDSQMSEWAFLTAICEQADCLILLDINNIYVSAFNHQFDALQYLKGVPKSRVRQFHLAGHLNLGDHIIDTHDHDVINEVWTLYSKALEIFGPISTMIERDDRIPALSELIKELDQARHIARDILKLEGRHDHA